MQNPSLFLGVGLGWRVELEVLEQQVMQRGWILNRLHWMGRMQSIETIYFKFQVQAHVHIFVSFVLIGMASVQIAFTPLPVMHLLNPCYCVLIVSDSGPSDEEFRASMQDRLTQQQQLRGVPTSQLLHTCTIYGTYRGDQAVHTTTAESSDTQVRYLWLSEYYVVFLPIGRDYTAFLCGDIFCSHCCSCNV